MTQADRYKKARDRFAKGQWSEAWQQCQQILARAPQHAEALTLSGRIRFAEGDHNGAIGLLQQAIAAQPRSASAYDHLGRVLTDVSRVDEAEQSFLRALQYARDGSAQARAIRLALVDVLLKKGRLEEAVAHFDVMAPTLGKKEAPLYARWGDALSAAGRSAEAADRYATAALQASTSQPGEPPYRLRQVAMLLDAGDHQQAEEVLASVRGVAPEAATYYALGELLYDNHQHGEARRAFDRAVQAATDDQPVNAVFKRGLSAWYLGDYPAADADFGQVLAWQPDHQGARNCRPFAQVYNPDATPEQVTEAHKAWGQYAASRVYGEVGEAPIRDRDPDRVLRVGYLSPDFHSHPVSMFLAPQLSFHDPSQVAVTCYSNVQRPDSVTAAFRQLNVTWRDITKLDDAAVAEQIRADGIDILVEMAGLTANNRLAVLARRVAPIQVSYIGYPTTSGLPGVDIRLTDHTCNPTGTDRLFTERLHRLPDCFCCYLTRLDIPDPNRLPALDNGHVTFGSLLNIKKINAQVVARWAAVLQAVPNAHMAIFRHVLRAREGRERLLALFVAEGIEPERIELHWKMPPDGSFMQLYHRVDMVLDTLPFCGHTSACEALWMGVPVVTRLGENNPGRMVGSILKGVGLPEFVAEDDDQFVAIAADWAGRLNDLDALRQRLRGQMAASPLTASEPFTRKIEAAYRQMWQDRLKDA